ncbi:hypothetical protein [Teredinibacter sp. KSP-S5-2]|uniref:hypothetical protein n=1 Tax=Teredinibacter sp. KSP-S5-2 TaxID=3034506 RepID=UPI0029348120|nr:hypothetical protein [Teredinibacter sp. KSP-S5-2]WNO11643.1 hypothetical protein P5V12_10715 [Teredinibacter sp. KSP-S5-2]
MLVLLLFVTFSPSSYGKQETTAPATTASTAEAPKTETKKDECDKSIPLLSEFNVTPTDSVDSTYTINFGRYFSPPDNSTTVKILQSRQIPYEIAQVRGTECTMSFLVLHGKFSTPKLAEREMWRLMSFPSPEPYQWVSLRATVAKKPAQKKQ